MNRYLQVFAFAALALCCRFSMAQTNLPYNCFQAEVKVGNAANGGERAGTIYYLAGWDMDKFVDELRIDWQTPYGARESDADLTCSGTVANRLCFLGEDSGRVTVRFNKKNGWPELLVYKGGMFLEKDDAGGYHMYAGYQPKTQRIHFIPVEPQTLCYYYFPEAGQGHGREVLVTPPPSYDGSETGPQNSVPLPIKPKP